MLRGRVRRIVILTVFLIVAALILFAYRAKIAPDLSDETQPYRAKWAVHGSPNYDLTVHVDALPAPPKDRIISFRNNMYIGQKRDPNCQFTPDSNFCDFQLNSPSDYSVPALFDTASACTNETKIAYASCQPMLASSFHGFTDSDALFDFDQTCGLLLESKILCSVQYDPTYGYPSQIAWDYVGDSDGRSIIEFKDLHLVPSNNP